MNLAKKHSQAYTLVELLGVVVIILIFSTILVASNRNATQGAQSVTAQQQQAQLQTAAEAWIASKPTLNAAIIDWQDSPAWFKSNDGPMKILAHNSMSAFTATGTGLTSPASLGQTPPTEFRIEWTNRQTQGPIVTQFAQ